ncbi:hypothetical protein SAMN05216604_11276 [Pseudomonas agarici]|nr:hypothetical protein SAMN05216604_11276 [Pseudomonas agarici]
MDHSITAASANPSTPTRARGVLPCRRVGFECRDDGGLCLGNRCR